MILLPVVFEFESRWFIIKLAAEYGDGPSAITVYNIPACSSIAIEMEMVMVMAREMVDC